MAHLILEHQQEHTQPLWWSKISKTPS